MRAYRSKEFYKFFAVADAANDVDFVQKDKSLHYLFNFCNMFITLYILYSTLFSLFSSNPKPEMTLENIAKNCNNCGG